MANYSEANITLDILTHKFLQPYIIEFFNQQLKENKRYDADIFATKFDFIKSEDFKEVYLDKNYRNAMFNFCGFGQWSYLNSLESLCQDLNIYTENNKSFQKRLNQSKYSPIINFKFIDTEAGNQILYYADINLKYDHHYKNWRLIILDNQEIPYKAKNLEHYGFYDYPIDKYNAKSMLKQYVKDNVLLQDFNDFYNTHDKKQWDKLTSYIIKYLIKDNIYIDPEYFLEDYYEYYDYSNKITNEQQLLMIIKELSQN